MAFKMRYSKDSFPYKTHLTRHVKGHGKDILTQNILDTRELSDEDYYKLKEMQNKESENIGPVESPEIIEKKEKDALEVRVGPSGTEFDATEEDWAKDAEERKKYRESQKYIKK